MKQEVAAYLLFFVSSTGRMPSIVYPMTALHQMEEGSLEIYLIYSTLLSSLGFASGLSSG